MKEVLVTGGNGQLGRELEKISGLFPELHLVFTDIADLDVADSAQLLNFFSDRKIDFLVNCAAYTAVDRAETEITEANRVNFLAAALLAEMASVMNFKLIHISTDYVYDETYSRPLRETDNTQPQSVYGISKLKGEKAIMKSSADAVIIRTSWLYSVFGQSFLKTIVNLSKTRDEIRVVNDQLGTPTWATDLAQCILHIVRDHKIKGQQIYNYSNEGQCSWYEFAKTIIELTNARCAVVPVSTSEYPQAAPRPAYSVLDKTKIKAAFGITIPHWKESLEKCLKLLETIK